MAPAAATDPMPLSMLAVVALVEVQVKVELCPAAIVVGAALMVTVGAPFTGCTVIVVRAVALPPAPLTVIV